VDSHRREKHSRPKGRLTPDQVAKLDRLAELARQDENALATIQHQLAEADDTERLDDRSTISLLNEESTYDD
jgi:hypothetical protein